MGQAPTVNILLVDARYLRNLLAMYRSARAADSFP